MQTKYEILLERSVKCQEDNNNISKSLLKVSENLEVNTKKMNDNFVLHNLRTVEMQKELKDIKNELMKWIKYLAAALFIAVGGTSIIRLILNGELNNLFK
ncbi:MAG: hypothetical protein P1P85_04130 [Patescibacteria group bacterium]|nr:hypothetical protein [Patescibacteria group bacterium]